MNDQRNHRRVLFSVIALFCCLFFISSVSAVDVFLTSDCISDKKTDVKNLKSIKGYINNGTLKGKANVTVDKEAPKPGEGERAISKSKKNGVAVYLAANCPGTMRAVAKKAKTTNKAIIYVNVGKLNLKKTNVLRRAWDDNFSEMEFAGIKTPYKFLRKAGVWVIQPNVNCKYGTQEQKNKYIADQISKIIKDHLGTSLTSTSGRYYNEKLILKHKVSPKTVAYISNAIYKTNKAKKRIGNKYYGYSTPRYLLMVSAYMNGAIPIPSSIKSPKNSHVKSTFSGTINKDSLRSMSAKVYRFIKKYKRAPSYLSFNGRIIGYKDLLLMYSKITKSHTSKSKMVLPKYYNFKKVYVY